MSRLEDAQRRLEHALDRLEEAAGKRGGAKAADLSRALDDAKRRGAALDARQREIGKRLDSAIGRLRTVLSG